MVKKVASRKVATKKTAASSVAKKPAPRKQVARQDAPVRHISPEEAVVHIQALLDAKHERDQRGPGWPGANLPHCAPDATDLHPPASGSGGGDDRLPAAQRNEQSKRKD
ncbi:MAG: hypothetical protein EPN71_00805 [Rhodanobacter sp.]|nr:MAG: hypothetical protein EPN71_00805 [Rhodanobacter sp.]